MNNPSRKPVEAGEEERAESLVEIACQRIEEMIVGMDLTPGERVSEPFLISQLGMGRTPIREALVKLSMDQLLIWLPKRGMVVREINLSSQLKVLETRRALEMVLVATAARRRTPAEAAELSAIVDRFRELRGTPDHMRLLTIDRVFILKLIEISNNPFLRAIVPLYALSRRFWLACESRQTRFRAETITDFHIAIGTAISDGDEPLATRLTKDFLDFVEQFTLYVGTELSWDAPAARREITPPAVAARASAARPAASGKGSAACRET